MLAGKDAYVIFENNTTLLWIKLLKKGYRHCKVFVKISKNIYLEINPLSNQLFIFLHVFESYADFAKVIHSHIHIKTKICDAPLKPAPIGLFTCVETIKRLLGIHNFFILTPHQLYKFLMVVGKKS